MAIIGSQNKNTHDFDGFGLIVWLQMKYQIYGFFYEYTIDHLHLISMINTIGSSICRHVDILIEVDCYIYNYLFKYAVTYLLIMILINTGTNPFSAGINFRRQYLTSTDVRL